MTSADWTGITWLVRRPAVGASFAGGGQDELPARGELGDAGAPAGPELLTLSAPGA